MLVQSQSDETIDTLSSQTANGLSASSLENIASATTQSFASFPSQSVENSIILPSSDLLEDTESLESSIATGLLMIIAYTYLIVSTF